MFFAVADNKKFMGMINSELNGASWTFDKPKVVIFDDADKKYIMEEEFSTDGKSLRAFIEKFNAGEVEAWVKSEDVPAEQGALKKVAPSTHYLTCKHVLFRLLARTGTILL